MARFTDKVAVVTGGARGMGAATSRLFAQEGARVVIADVLDEEGAALAQALGAAALYRHLDVTDERAWRQLVEDVERQWGGIDILVNNAGVIIMKGLLDMSREEFARVIDINLIGTFLGIKSVAPALIRRGRGAIVNISSVDGMKGANALAAYASSKWGVRGLTRVAAMELGHRGVRVNSVHPGGVNTAMSNFGGQSAEQLNPAYRGQPIQRIGEPEEVARATLFLASDDASYICGAELAVDGGQLTGHYYDALPGAPAAS